ncbi:MAG: heme biosynthesis HemY N-terminal domain-containing protein [Burkholderiales bacterium]|nr:heme biosynthesis HemY N-terminal domain-containing protein [Burkholderiales bacterium]
MRGLIWLLVVFAAAIGFALVGASETGYVLFVYPPYRVELSLILFVLAALAGFVLLYFVARLLYQLVALPGQLREYRARRRQARAQGALVASVQAYFEGRYLRAERDAERAYDGGAAPGVSALLAARAAHRLRDFAGRDRWLARAEAVGESVRIAQTLTRAELALEERDFQSARSLLRSLPSARAKEAANQRLLLRAERGAGNWEEVERMASRLAKDDAIPPALAEEARIQAAVELLRRDAGDRKVLERRWRKLTEREQLHPRVAEVAARRASALGATMLAREIIENSLAHEWSHALALQYSELPALEPGERASEARARIARAERWLQERAEDPALLTALGRLCVHAELWGKAQSYLEASLSLEESRAAHLDLARLAERLERDADAQRHYRRAAELE